MFIILFNKSNYFIIEFNKKNYFVLISTYISYKYREFHNPPDPFFSKIAFLNDNGIYL